MAIGDSSTRFFDVVVEDAVRKALGDNLPLVGTAIAAKAATGLNPFSDLQSRLAAAVATTANDATAIANAINAAAIPNVTASLVGGEVQIAIAASDVLQIEVVGGSGNEDVIRGDGSVNYIDGWLGDDLIEGRGTSLAGHDTLLGVSTVLPVLSTDGSAEGAHSVAIQATDAFGNVADGATLGFVLDTIGPRVTIDAVSRPQNYVTHTISGSVDAEGLGSSVIVRDGAEVLGTASVDMSGRWNLTFQFDGDGPIHDYALTATGTAVDAAGNVGSDTFDFAIDSTPNRPIFQTLEHDPVSSAGKIYSLYDGLLGRTPDAGRGRLGEQPVLILGHITP